MADFNVLMYWIAFLYGLMFGSFFNVCIFRIPKGLSIVSPKSHCLQCGFTIPWFLNVPILSYLFLHGKCAGCKSRISWVYPGVELLTGLLAFAIFWHFSSLDFWDWMIRSVIYFVFFGSLLIASFIDLRYLIIPDRFTIGGTFTGVLISTIYPALHAFGTWQEGFVYSSVSAFICYAVLGSIRILGSYAYGREAMGYGDVKLMGALGAFLGWKLGLLSVFFAAVLGSVFGIAQMLISKKHLRTEIPFGPYLALGALSSIFFGKYVFLWYSQFLIFY